MIMNLITVTTIMVMMKLSRWTLADAVPLICVSTLFTWFTTAF